MATDLPVKLQVKKVLSKVTPEQGMEEKPLLLGLHFFLPSPQPSNWELSTGGMIPSFQVLNSPVA